MELHDHGLRWGCGGSPRRARSAERQCSGHRWRVELDDQVDKLLVECGFVVVRMPADDVERFAIAVGGLPVLQGFPRYRDKSSSLSATVNKFLRVNGFRPTKDHSVYSLRHS